MKIFIICLFFCFFFSPLAIFAADKKSEPSNLRQSEGYGLLYKLLSDESQLDLILIIKNAPPSVANLLKEITELSGNGKKTLEKLKNDRPVVSVDHRGLPKAEIATRDSIRQETSHVLLHASGSDFSLHILLTQIEALNYMRHLSLTLQTDETNPLRRHFLDRLADASGRVRERVISQLEVKPVK